MPKRLDYEISSSFFNMNTKVKNTTASGKCILTVFWDCQGVVHHEYIEKKVRLIHKSTRRQ